MLGESLLRSPVSPDMVSPMKKLLMIITLSLCFITPSQAEDNINNLLIEGVSVGDSLLNFYDKELIENKKVFIYKNKKFFSFSEYNPSKFKNFDLIQVHLKNNDNKYKCFFHNWIIIYHTQDHNTITPSKEIAVFYDLELLYNVKRLRAPGNRTPLPKTQNSR